MIRAASRDGHYAARMTTKLDTAGTLERIFEMYSRQFSVLLPMALVIYLPVAALQIFSSGSIVLLVLAGIVGIVAGTLFQGAVVQAVRDMQDGKRDHSPGELISSALPFILPLIGVGILAGIGIGIGLILCLVPGLFLLTIWALVAPVVVVEGSGVMGAFGRSRELVKGNGWQVFGVLIVMFLITLVAQQVLLAIGSGIGDDVGRGLGFLVAATLTAPLSALTASVLYFTLVGMQAAPGAAGAPAAPADPPFPPAPGTPGAPPSGENPFGR